MESIFDFNSLCILNIIARKNLSIEERRRHNKRRCIWEYLYGVNIDQTALMVGPVLPNISHRMNRLKHRNNKTMFITSLLVEQCPATGFNRLNVEFHLIHNFVVLTVAIARIKQKQTKHIFKKKERKRRKKEKKNKVKDTDFP